MNEPDNLPSRLRHALQQEADTVTPADDGLARIRQRIADGESRPWWRRPRMAGAGAAVLAAAATVGVVAVAGGIVPEHRAQPPIGGDPSSAVPTNAPSDTATVVLPPAPVAIYYLGDRARLFREWHQVELPVSTVPVRPGELEALPAVRALLDAPPEDPDYKTGWAEQVEVRSVEHGGGLITVDLTGPVVDMYPGAELTPEYVTGTVQQLVYTVQAAYRTTEPVRVLVDGEPVDTIVQGYDSSQPIERADPLSVLAPIQVTAPQHGDQLSSPVRVEGPAAVFEANLLWTVLAGGTVVDSGQTTASAGAPGFGHFGFDVRLDPGSYRLEVYSESAEDGTKQFPDTKSFTVR